MWAINLVHKSYYYAVGIIDDPRDSIFTYGPSGSWNNFYRPDYLPLFEAKFNDPELEQEAIQVIRCSVK